MLCSPIRVVKQMKNQEFQNRNSVLLSLKSDTLLSSEPCTGHTYETSKVFGPGVGTRPKQDHLSKFLEIGTKLLR